MQDGSLYRKRAQALGPSVDAMILGLLGRGQGFIDTRKIWGILSLDKEYTGPQIDAACRRALEVASLSYRTVKSFLELETFAALERSGAQRAGGETTTASPKMITHKHVRPLSVYREQLQFVIKKESRA